MKFSENGPVDDSFRKIDDTRFNLIVIGQQAPDAASLGLGNMISVHAIPAGPENDGELARTQMRSPSFYLVRPDGYVGLCGERLDASAVKRFASEQLSIGM